MKVKNYEQMFREIPIEVTRASLALIRTLSQRDSRKTLSAVKRLLSAVHKVDKKRESDRATDATRRKLVGARVPLALYERCRRAAEADGVSLYRWCIDAFDAAILASHRAKP